MQEPRQRFLMLKIGAPGTGKSSGAAEIIKDYQQNVIVLKHIADIEDPAMSFLPLKTMDNWRQGVKPGAFAKCKMSVATKKEYQAFIQWAQKHFRNGLVMIDDALNFERNQSSEDLINLVSLRRKYGMDIIIAFYGLGGVPIDLFPFLNYAVFYNTNDKFEYKKNKVPRMDQMVEKQVEAQQNWLAGLSTGNKELQYKPAIVKFY